MSINKQRPINQLELFEKPRILVVTLLIGRATFYVQILLMLNQLACVYQQILESPIMLAHFKENLV
jgi:hypothetical protein